MKRSLFPLTLSVILLLPSISYSAVVYNKDGNLFDLYGKLVAKEIYVEDSSHTRKEAGFGSIGFKGQTQISSNLTGFGQWEYRAYTNAAEDDTQTTETRLAFAGLKYQGLGSVDYGYNNGILYDVGSLTDMAPSWSAMTWTGSLNKNFMNSRSEGVLTFRSNDLLGLYDKISVGVQLQGKNETNSVYTANGNGIGYSLGYEITDGLKLIGAYSNSSRTSEQREDGKGNRAESWAVGAKYDANRIYLATLYSETRNTTRTGSTGLAGFANKTSNFEFLAQYLLESGFRPSVGWFHTRGYDLTPVGSFNGGDADLANYIELGVSYNFNPNFRVYIDYYINLLDEGTAYVKQVGGLNGNDNMTALNMSYYF
ncbi:porin [Pantoea vagans]|uniref:porin n=1 Tax=Pantoea vagans TaxID=470934 RepID=UPI003019FB4A